MQLLKDNIEAPTELIDLEPVTFQHPRGRHGLRWSHGSDERYRGASGVRAGWPMVAQALEASASPQVRNMGTMAVTCCNELDCGYFRDTGFACNNV